MTHRLWDEARLPAYSDEAVWELFHENSKVGRYDPFLPPEVVLERMRHLYQSLSFDNLPAVPLPPPREDLTMPVTEAVRRRRTPDNLTPCSLALVDVATLLHHAYGITGRAEDTGYIRPFRAVPSGGALYPLELFLHSAHLRDAPSGLYHYNPPRHELRRLADGDLTPRIAAGLVQPNLAPDTSLHLFITALFNRSTFKYGNRGYRFTLLEAGHVAQNLNLVATAMGLATVNVGGFRDREVDELLGLDGLNHATIYMTCIGLRDDSGA